MFYQLNQMNQQMNRLLNRTFSTPFNFLVRSRVILSWARRSNRGKIFKTQYHGKALKAFNVLSLGHSWTLIDSANFIDFTNFTDFTNFYNTFCAPCTHEIDQICALTCDISAVVPHIFEQCESIPRR